jgi:hypothetical protein
MPEASPILSSFNAGELSPLMEGRVDFPKYDKGCSILENMIPSVQGPALRRPGTQYLGDTKHTGDAVYLITFEANSGANFVLELGNGYIRFWNDRKPVNLYADGSWSPAFNPVDTGLGPAEVAVPWNSDQLVDPDGVLQVQYAQSNDIMWLVHPLFFPLKLRRTDLYKFEISKLGDGVNPPSPFNDQNIDESITVWCSAELKGAPVTITATSPIFAGRAGEYFYVGQPAADILKPWEVNKAKVLNDRVRSDGRNYIALNAATTGTLKPTHSSGAKFDGATGVQWQYTDDGYGTVKIDSVSSDGKTAQGTIISRLPGSVVSLTSTPPSPQTHRWATQSWTDALGYPRAISFAKARLCFGRGQTMWSSVQEDFENFQATDAGSPTADLAITATIAADRNDRILWMSNQGDLLCGTASTEYLIGPLDQTQPFGPGNVSAQPQSFYGSRPLQPLKVGEAVFFVQRGGQRLREALFDIQIDKFRSNDLSALAQHITYGDRSVTGRSGILCMAWQREPDTVIWCARGDGMLVAFTYSREHEVFAWGRCPIAGHLDGDAGNISYGQVLGLACIPSPDGALDDLYLTVRRSINGVWRTFVEVLGPHVSSFSSNVYYYHELPNTTEVAYLDANVFSTVASNGFAEVPHLTGEQAAGTMEGMYISAQDTSSGVLSCGVANEGKRVCGGLEYRSVLQTMRLNAGSATGSSQGKFMAIQNLTIRVKDTINVLYGPDFDTLDREPFRKTGSQLGVATPLYTGDKQLDWPAGDEFGSRVTLVQDQPFPMTIVALMPQVNETD